MGGVEHDNKRCTFYTLSLQVLHVTSCHKREGGLHKTPPQGRKIRLKLKTWCNLTTEMGSVSHGMEQPKWGQSRLDTFFSALFFSLPLNKPPPSRVCVCVWISEAVCDLFCVGYPPMAKTRSRQRGQFILDG